MTTRYEIPALTAWEHLTIGVAVKALRDAWELDGGVEPHVLDQLTELWLKIGNAKRVEVACAD